MENFAKYFEQLGSMTSTVSKQQHDTLHAMITEIRKLKKEKNAKILSHYYMPASLQITEEMGGIADFTGDSLGLSVNAMNVSADHIIFCGVKFMAETAKILNPLKKILLPDMHAGCSLASSITGKDVIELKRHHPGVPVIAYINTYAETKAEVDVCCTSRNALKIAKSYKEDKLIFVPDEFMGRNLRSVITRETGKEMILWSGKCEVHEQFNKRMIDSYTLEYPEAEVLVHWEVPDEAVNSSLKIRKGIVGSTSDILNYVGNSKAQQFILGSECDLGATLKGMYRDKEFVTPCITCPHMKTITMENTLEALRAIGTFDEEKYLVDVPEPILSRAYTPIRRMIDLS